MTRFYACYDYGQGGVWIALDAPDRETARRGLNREWDLYEERPEWMTDRDEESLDVYPVTPDTSGTIP